ncbi:UDP-3-O-acyl N-acetylglucosamine deacetylase [Dillenia turbinata]|uniref:UDP-3-O-acyl N-acetylglucosamine deacetylase n=1 Tax=Dillenia turbinata TaxID=194707 RepID=A0AAN8ZF77_9MAGN
MSDVCPTENAPPKMREDPVAEVPTLWAKRDIAHSRRMTSTDRSKRNLRTASFPSSISSSPLSKELRPETGGEGVPVQHPAEMALDQDLHTPKVLLQVPSQLEFDTDIHGRSDQVEKMRNVGLIKGSSKGDAIVCSVSEGWLNRSLHFLDEPCHHKVPDLIGDLSLISRDGNQGLSVAYEQEMSSLSLSYPHACGVVL